MFRGDSRRSVCRVRGPLRFELIVVVAWGLKERDVEFRSELFVVASVLQSSVDASVLG